MSVEKGLPHIDLYGIAFIVVLFIMIIWLNVFLKTKILKEIFISSFRMVLQLFFMGMFLVLLFKWNNIPLNVLWFFVMVVFATTSVIRSTSLRFKFFFLPVFFSFSISTWIVIMYINALVLSLSNVFDARFFIVIGGMLLGNSLKGNIIGINAFFKTIVRDENRYIYRLSLGFSLREAILPYLREAFVQGIKPLLASMATMGIVFLPGMMTGQIISGINPIEAIKYQVMIMIAIFFASNLSLVLTMFFSIKSSFDSYGMINKSKLFRS